MVIIGGKDDEEEEEKDDLVGDEQNTFFFQWELKQNNLSQKLKLNSKTKRQARKGSKKNPDLIFKEISQKIQNS